MARPLLTDADIQQHLSALPGWSRSGNALVKTYTFPDFIHAMQFVNQIAEAAEAVQHHPDIDIRYSSVTLSLSTHNSGGITHNDISSAASADGFADAVGLK